MINKISAINHANYVTKINFKSNEQNNVLETKTTDFSRINAQSNYGIAQIKLSKLMDIKPLKSQLLLTTNPENYEGVKVYDSEGNFAGIIKKDEKTTSYYLPNSEKNEINTIKVINNKTNKLINQESLVYDDDRKYIYVKEFSPVTGKKLASATYRNGEFVYAGSYSYLNNGSKTVKTYDPEDETYRIEENDLRNNRHSYIRFTKDFKQADFEESIEKGNVKYEKGVTFYNGAMVSTYEHKDTVIPNMMGREVLNDTNLVPTKKFNANIISNALKDGEKTYFTNGSIETITKGDMTAKYSLNGDLTEFESKNVKVYFYENNEQEIEIKLNENTTKTTIYDTNGDISVEYKDGNNVKHLHLNQKLQAENYEEYILTDDDKNWQKDFYYQNGMLSKSYEY